MKFLPGNLVYLREHIGYYSGVTVLILEYIEEQPMAEDIIEQYPDLQGVKHPECYACLIGETIRHVYASVINLYGELLNETSTTI